MLRACSESLSCLLCLRSRTLLVVRTVRAAWSMAVEVSATAMGGTMRLGNRVTIIKDPDSLAGRV